MPRDKILDRVQKLLRVARGRANEHESAVAAAAAERLMREHQISHSDVVLDDLARGDALATQDVGAWPCCPRWKGLLAVAVARLFDCEVDRCDHPHRPGHETLRFYGYAADALVARWTFDYLVDAVDRLVDAAWPPDHAVDDVLRGARRDYRTGVLQTLIERLDEATAAKRRPPAEDPAGERHALLLRSKAQAIRDAFGDIDYRAEVLDVDLDGPYLHGRRDGRRIPVHRPLTGATAPALKP